MKPGLLIAIGGTAAEYAFGDGDSRVSWLVVSFTGYKLVYGYTCWMMYLKFDKLEPDEENTPSTGRVEIMGIHNPMT